MSKMRVAQLSAEQMGLMDHWANCYLRMWTVKASRVPADSQTALRYIRVRDYESAKQKNWKSAENEKSAVESRDQVDRTIDNLRAGRNIQMIQRLSDYLLHKTCIENPYLQVGFIFLRDLEFDYKKFASTEISKINEKEI